MNFQDEVVLVTGASRGIGREIALQFAQRGARVLVHYHRNREAAEASMAALPGEGHMLVQADLADPEALRLMVDAAVEAVGRIDILVNNAGIYEEHPLLDVSYAEWQEAWRRTMDTNLFGAANLIYCVVHHMIRQGGGRVVNVSSRGAFRGEPTAPAYGASKAAMNSMGQSLARALAPHSIFIGTVAPGFVETDMARDILDGPEGEGIRQQSPLGRVARPAEVAHAVLFLATKEASFSTGTIIDVNGASYLRS